MSDDTKTTPAKHVPTTIIVPSDATPTFFNENILDGAILGSLFSERGGFFHKGTAIGAVVGSLLGKVRMDHEYEHGTKVSKPWSEGFSIATGAVGIAAIAGLLTWTFPVSGAVIGTATALGAGAGGLIGKSSYQRRQREYEFATNYYMEHGGNYKGRAEEAKHVAKDEGVTQEDVAAMKARIAELEGKKTDRVAADKAVPAQQQR